MGEFPRFNVINKTVSKVIKAIECKSIDNAERMLIMASLTSQLMKMLEVDNIETESGKITLSESDENITNFKVQ